MAAGDRTLEQSWLRDPAGDLAAGPPQPGLIMVFSGRRAELACIALASEPVNLGRGTESDVPIDDSCMSRLHAEVSFAAGRFRVRDLGSRNGTFVDGAPAPASPVSEAARVLRTGDTLFLMCRDVRPYRDAVVDLSDGVVVGPRLRAAFDDIEAAARGGDGLHVTGESGVGKELAARRFHAASGRPDGPFVAVNCATIPAALAERLLFGARKGAYSGADADSEGHLQAAHGGTLFLDEVAELSLEVQAKLLRAIETRTVQALGAARAQPVDLRLVSATHGDLRAAAAAGRFREDLYFRLGRPMVALPPLRERAEELPWLLQVALSRAAADLSLHVSLVEAVLLRSWPGNARELVTELGDAARRAIAAGARVVMARHLGATAGQALASGAPASAAAFASPAPADDTDPLYVPGGPDGAPLSLIEQNERAVIARALEEHRDSMGAAARVLGVSRATLYRKIGKYGLDKK